MVAKFSIKKYLENSAFSNQLLKAANFLHFTKITPEPFSLKDEKCLLLAPHPDDETFACAGMLLNHPKNFHVMCITDGRSGGYLLSDEENIVVRKNEFVEAMNFYGIKSYDFLEIQDRKLIYNYENFSSLHISDYDYIFLPNCFDQHKDHKAVTVLLQKFLKNNKHKSTLKIVFYEMWSPLPLINKMLDITPIIEKKKDAMRIYESQHNYLNFMDGIIGLNQYRGMQISVGYAEGYCLTDVKTFHKL